MSSDTKKLLMDFIKSLGPEDVAKAAQAIEKSELGAAFSGAVEPKKPQWSDRTTGREVSPADWIKMHYGRVLPDGAWDPMGLTRNTLRQIDRPLYQAFCKYLSRLPRNDEGKPNVPEFILPLVETISERVQAELKASGIISPEEAWKTYGSDPIKAERLRGAARRHTKLALDNND